MLITYSLNFRMFLNCTNIHHFSFSSQYSLIKKYGYPAENHSVTTDDGYILTVHRIARHGATPVLLVHGLLDSSATWVMMGPNKGLGINNEITI